MRIVKWFKRSWGWFRGDGDDDMTGADPDDGKRDFIFNTLTKIVEDNDTSIWAIFSFIFCTSLLVSGRRWPDESNAGDEAPNRWIWFPYKWVTRESKRRWTRPQDDLTRDPYKAYRGCFAHLIKENNGEYDVILWYAFKSIRLPWYLWRLEWWIDWKRTINNNRKHFVKRLDYIDGRATETLFKKFYADDFYKDRL